MAELWLDRSWSIPDAELTLRFVRSPGPGGQNVNKVATKAEVRFDVAGSSVLTGAQKRRLVRAFPAHVTLGGEFIVTSDRYRSQNRNLQDALAKLADMIRSIRRPPKRRVPTRVPAAAKRRRVADKRARGELKRQRKGAE